MSRELKFRAYSLKYKCYVDIWQITFDDENLPSVIEFEYEGLLRKELANTFVIEQYTDLKDKNGKEIYEGDIVMYGRKVFRVEFDEMKDSDCFYYYLGWAIGDLSLCEHNTMVEVIGNIHENPELLGGGE